MDVVIFRGVSDSGDYVCMVDCCGRRVVVSRDNENGGVSGGAFCGASAVPTAVCVVG